MEKQELFFKELAAIQDLCVNVALCKAGSYSSTEEMLKDVTGETIYRVMELLDGYGRDLKLARCNIVDTITGEVINAGIELHDKCVEYLEDPFAKKVVKEI